MAKKRIARSTAGISDEAVRKATGKTWAQWCTLLDKAGCREMNHKQIVAVVHGTHGIGPWWQQMVTVGYEQARGLREKHQTASGYAINRSKTFGVPVKSLYAAWAIKKSRAAWLRDHRFTIRTATANKSMRITWVDGKTSLEVNFYRKGPGKSSVAVQHGKLPDSKAGETMKRYWAGALDNLRAFIEPGVQGARAC
jgi:uncharacterized protein YndB with AHSA1/START domain